MFSLIVFTMLVLEKYLAGSQMIVVR